MIGSLIRPAIAAMCLTLAASVARAELEVQEITSPGGIDVWLLESHDIPFVAIEIAFSGGSGLDAPGKRGAAYLMSGLIEEGAADLNATEFQALRESLAASFGFRVYDDNFYVSAKVLTENRDEAMALLRDALVEPRFDDDAIERVRSQVLSGLRSDAQDPGWLGSERWFSDAYGDHHYGSPKSGTIESVEALTRDDLLQSYRDILVQDGVSVAAVGDITPEELGGLVDRLLGDLPEDGPEPGGRAEYLAPGGIEVVDFATPQAVIYFGHEGLARDDDDFFAAYVLNRILGQGTFESRLGVELRENRGLTYGVSTSLLPMDDGEVLYGRMSTANANVVEAIEVLRDEWRKLAEAGVTQDELDAAKTYLTGEYPLRFDGNGPIARILLGMQIEDLPPSYIQDRNSYIEAVTLEEINRVAAELLDPEALHFVVVGQPEGMAMLLGDEAPEAGDAPEPSVEEDASAD